MASYRTIKMLCIDCGKILKGHRNNILRCKSHARKYQYQIKPETHPMKGKKGKDSPGWIDGRTLIRYPPEFNDNLKLKIRDRDNHECQNCHMTEEEHIVIYVSNIEIHHIDYNKMNCKEDNLIALCKQCNIRANFNREYWIEHYNLIIETKLCQKEE